MNCVTTLTVDRLRALLDYDPDSGIFTRRIRTASRHKVGDRADFLIASGVMAGYLRVSIDYERHLAHRLAWMHVHGSWPTNEIDHIDGNRGNNRIANLRDVTRTTNKENMRAARKDNQCGLLGVHWHAPTDQWRASIQVHGRAQHIGLFHTPEAAHLAYVETKRRLHEGCTI